MPVKTAKVEYSENELAIILPMTQPTGKVRVRARTFFAEYGNPVATRKEPLTQQCYIEWQIGYDIPANENNINETTLSNQTFNNYKHEKKFAYELSEILFYSHKLGFIDDFEIIKTYEFIQAIPGCRLVDTIDSMRIARTNPIQTQINNIDFFEMKVTYPLIVHKFGKYDIYSEIMNREKQKAVGVQPMLFVCIPITELVFEKNPIGRIMEAKECGRWIIKTEEARLSLEIFKIFGMLSKKHQYDVLAIMRMLFRHLSFPRISD